MTKKITIIGAGPGGYIAAIRAAQLGADVTVIEQDNVGGTCLNQGCIPSKIMKKSADILNLFQRSEEFGIVINDQACLDVKRLMTRKENIIQNQRKGILTLLKKYHIQYIRGYGEIKGEKHVIVKSEDSTIQDIYWDSLIIATGSKPLNIPAFPFDGKQILSSNDALNIQEIPISMVIVGGGVIGCEFAFIFASFGTKVTVIEALPRLLPLPSVDESCSAIIQREMKKRNIEFMINHTVKDVEKNEKNLKIRISPSQLIQKEESPLTIEAEKMLVCIGRSPNTLNIGLELLKIQKDSKGWIQVNEKMETNIPGVYAVGDLLGPSKIMLAHVASREGLIAAENAMEGNLTMQYERVPGVIFTMPEVANIGLTEIQAKEQGYPVRAESVLFRNIGKSHVIGEIAGEAKIISDSENEKILGIHITGTNAGELIAEASLVMQMGGTVNDLAETIHAHPTLSEIMTEASFKSMGKGIHG